MSEWEEKLNTLLSDPDAMAQVMSMAQNLSQQLGAKDGDPAAPDGDAADSGTSDPGSSAPPDLSSLLGSLDPAAIRKLTPLLSQLNRPESGETAAFLRAMRPFLKPERQEKIDRAAQLARLIHLAKTFLLSGEG